MKFIRCIKNFITHNVTIIVIPDITKKTKQYKFYSFITYSFLTAFVVLIVFVSITSVYFYKKSDSLTLQNTVLNSKLKTDIETIAILENETSEQNIQICELSKKNIEILDYLNTRIIEVNDLRSHLATTIASFNENNDTDISIPISRSLDRTSIENIYESKNYDDINSELDFDEIQRQGELSEIINELKIESVNLTSEIENQLEYLDCLPDYVPVEGRITSNFGYRIHPISGLRSFHNGIDISANIGVPVHAAGSGIVVFSGWSGNYGNIVIISHGYGYESIYAHNNKLFVNVGDIVEKGSIISEVGTTGNSTGAHLHFEVHLNDELVDPTSILNFN